jgi:hypothetical protein
LILTVIGGLAEFDARRHMAPVKQGHEAGLAVTARGNQLAVDDRAPSGPTRASMRSTICHRPYTSDLCEPNSGRGTQSFGARLDAVPDDVEGGAYIAPWGHRASQA